MDLQAAKSDIIQWLTKVNDKNVIKQFMLLKKSNEERDSVNLSAIEKEAITKGLDSIKEGRSELHDKVMETTRAKYSELFKQ
jgi:hypothetical protein